MEYQEMMWVSAVGILLVGFVLRLIQRARVGSGDEKVLEWGDPDDIYAREDDDL